MGFSYKSDPNLYGFEKPRQNRHKTLNHRQKLDYPDSVPLITQLTPWSKPPRNRYTSRAVDDSPLIEYAPPATLFINCPFFTRLPVRRFLNRSERPYNGSGVQALQTIICFNKARTDYSMVPTISFAYRVDFDYTSAILLPAIKLIYHQKEAFE